MSTFSCEAAPFFSFIKKLSFLVKRDAAEAITFVKAAGSAEVSAYFRIQLDKSETFGYATTKTPLIGELPDAIKFSLSVTDLLGIKVPELGAAKKQDPKCGPVSCSLTENQFSLEYKVRWKANQKPSTTKLVFAVLASGLDLKKLAGLLTCTDGDEVIKLSLSADDLSNIVILGGAVKTDQTSKDSNGCLLIFGPASVDALVTDSAVAGKYSVVFPSPHIKQPIRITVSAAVLQTLKILSDGGDLELQLHNNNLFYRDQNCIAVLPGIGSRFPISKPEDIFASDGNAVALFSLKPVIDAVETLVSKSTDAFKLITLKTGAEAIELVSGTDCVSDLFAQVTGSSKALVNGQFLLSCLKRFPKDSDVSYFYKKEVDQLQFKVASPDFTFVIQGISE